MRCGRLRNRCSRTQRCRRPRPRHRPSASRSSKPLRSCLAPSRPARCGPSARGQCTISQAKCRRERMSAAAAEGNQSASEASSGVGANGDRLHAREEPDHDDRPNDASRQGQRPRRPAYRVFSGAREGGCGSLHHRAAGRPQAEQGVVLRRMFGVGEARHPPIRQAGRRGARARRAAVHPALRLRRARQGHDDHGRVAPALGCLQDALDRAPRDPDGHGAGARRRRGQGIRGVGSQRKGRGLRRGGSCTRRTATCSGSS